MVDIDGILAERDAQYLATGRMVRALATLYREHPGNVRLACDQVDPTGELIRLVRTVAEVLDDVGVARI